MLRELSLAFACGRLEQRRQQIERANPSFQKNFGVVFTAARPFEICDTTTRLKMKQIKQFS